MLQLSSMVTNRPVLSLRTGGEVATAIEPVINPANLKIEGFYCVDSQSRQQLVLVTQDIRDIMTQGIVINDHDVLMLPNELIRMADLFRINFTLLGKPVVTSSGTKLGKVSDYAVNTDNMFIQKMYVSQSMFKNFNGGNLGVDRSQIIEINDKKVIVADLTQKMPARAGAMA